MSNGRQAGTNPNPARSREELLRRNPVFESFFHAEAPRLAEACKEMSRRFLTGGRLLAFGHGSAATDAEHVSVEFVHPVIVGKRALPALDVGPDFERRLPVLLRPQDMVMGFASPGGDEAVERSLKAAREAGALTFALTGEAGEHPFAAPDEDPFIVQEIFEVLYHVLWETVHVFFEHREQGHDVGGSSFLYPFLGRGEQPLEAVVGEVQGSMLQKMRETNRLRALAAETEAERISVAAGGISERLRAGGKIIAFGNGGSATDANDLAADCVDPPCGLRPVPAVSLSFEPANVTAIANDIGPGAIFARQLIAHARPEDAAVAFSTSGGSKNILSALAEARKRGLLTVAILGYDGGRVLAEGLADHTIVVRSDYIPRIQEVQASIYHTLRRLIDGPPRKTG
ncbi:SIS domain-containing protein [Rubrobacter tropicus]|uniref:SIS domain-containing protein n=1 Tax=Rubrobacter tropicus TaxID=2653851 RepID=A0A6G8QF89_9ACTN|nr:SIS domain-containing protein [Rubrobacter tropicus]QIN85165.1 SIS domain-containing protein [Rubrobacter tropicus]